MDRSYVAFQHPGGTSFEWEKFPVLLQDACYMVICLGVGGEEAEMVCLLLGLYFGFAGWHLNKSNGQS